MAIVPPRNTSFSVYEYLSGNSKGTVVAQERVRVNCAKLAKHDEGIMMKKISLYAVFVALALFVAVPMAHATTVTEVQAMIATLKTKTTNVTITGKQAETKDRPGLLEKINEASLKVDQAKFCDAVVKINDFKNRVNALIAAGKINQDPALGTTGTELLADADAIIAGLNDLQVQNTGAACAF